MRFVIVAKKMVRIIISNQIFNLILTSVLNFLKPFIPENVLFRIPKVGIVTCALSNSKRLLLFSEGDDTIASRLYFKGLDGFEAETVQLFLRLAANSRVVLDIGANTGIYALIAAIEDSAIEIYAFEPVPKIYERLEKNVEINKVTNLHINSSAVTNFDGIITLYIPNVGNMPTSSSTLQGFRKANEAIQVNAITVDSYIIVNNITKIDLIKIDTEATEHLVLEGAVQTLERYLPMIICEVLKGRTERQLQTILDKFNYRYFWITGAGLIERELIEGDGSYKYNNYLFIHAENIKKISDLIIMGS